MERDERKVFLSDIGGKPVPTSTASSSLLSAEKNTIDLGAPLPKAAFDVSVIK